MTDANPDAVAGDYLQGRFAASQQAYGVAADAFHRAALVENNPDLIASAFRYALAAGDIAKASDYARTMLAAPEEQDLSHMMATGSFIETDLPRLTIVAEAFAANDIAKADTLLAEPFESPLGISISQLLKGWAAYDLKGVDAGTEILLNPPNGAFAGFNALHLALMYDRAGEGGTAELAYGEALVGPAADTAVVAYTGFVEREQDRAKALELYHKLAADRGFLRRLGRMGAARLDDPLPGETKEFVRMARKAPLRLVSNSREGAALVFQNFAWSAYEQALQRQEAAEQAGFQGLDLALDFPLALAQLAAAVDSDLGAAHYVIGAIANAYDQYEVAAAANGRVSRQSWLYNYAAIDQADAYLSLGREDDAIALIRDYLKEDALAPDVLLTLANLLAQNDQFDGADEAATKGIEVANNLSTDDTRSDNLWRYYFARGAIRVEADRWEDGEADLRQALSLSPNEPMLLNFLGYSYVERGENVDEAFGMIERALEARPASGAITDSLGWAHYQRGNYSEAVKLLERAVELEPGDDVITDHLGDAYWRDGRKIEARFEWRRVLEMDNLSDEMKAKVEAKLAGEPPAPGSLAPAE
ncbi:tetratricopeptide repeat protein [Parvularcula sp. LCG005]|uniref:tetratricopeptide repeat protein n=1 Tax=Parvularcula sp. LCG005 TaxID=3078805 RepID=UPI002942611B|nr:tetratricopeptide repeat protein [Parvularcula sp. LCG005]WOI52105.1 tetratricopeptide repeat protein [Parvularcula sp. LCG005]